jgi:hypothetical protein
MSERRNAHGHIRCQDHIKTGRQLARRYSNPAGGLRLRAANTASPVSLSAYFAGPEWRAAWQRRSKQLEENPADAERITQYYGNTNL